MAGRGMVLEIQDGNQVQHDLVSWYWFKPLESDPKQFISDICKHSTTLEESSFENY